MLFLLHLEYILFVYVNNYSFFRTFRLDIPVVLYRIIDISSI